MPTLQQGPGVLNIQCKKGDDLSFRLTFSSMDLSLYDFEAAVVHSGNETPFTITETDLPHGILHLTLTDEQTAAIPYSTANTWYFRWTLNGATRTILAGSFLNV